MSRLCAQAGCYTNAIDDERFCDEHITAAREREANKLKPFAQANSANSQWYKTARWNRLSKKVRNDHPFCAMCGREDTLSVHHMKEGALSEDEFFDENILVVLCRLCHQRVTQLHTVEIKKERANQ